jgi:hypothetical protein
MLSTKVMFFFEKNEKKTGNMWEDVSRIIDVNVSCERHLTLLMDHSECGVEGEKREKYYF